MPERSSSPQTSADAIIAHALAQPHAERSELPHDEVVQSELRHRVIQDLLDFAPVLNLHELGPLLKPLLRLSVLQVIQARLAMPDCAICADEEPSFRRGQSFVALPFFPIALLVVRDPTHASSLMRQHDDSRFLKLSAIRLQVELACLLAACDISRRRDGCAEGHSPREGAQSRWPAVHNLCGRYPGHRRYAHRRRTTQHCTPH